MELRKASAIHDDMSIENISHSVPATHGQLKAPHFTVKSLVKPGVFVLLGLPFVWLVFALLSNRLGANPIEAVTDFTGEWALRMLMLSLAMTPLRMLFRKPWPIRYRRMIGLYAFFYVFTHLLTYVVLDQQLDVAAIFADVFERPYITAGTVAFLILLPLALTSTKGMMKRLGKRWLSLHKWVYVAAAAAVLHYIWLARGDRLEPFVYLGILLVLMAFRAKKWLARKKA